MEANRMASGAVIVLSALLAGPIFARNTRLYGEPTGLQRMSAMWGQHDPPLSYVEALREIPNVWTSFRARFWYAQIPLPNGIYQSLLEVASLATAGLIFWFVRERKRVASVMIWQIILLVVVGVGYGFSVVSNVRVSLTGAYGRFAFPALPAYALLLFLGLSGLTPRRWHAALAAVTNAGMFAFATTVLIVWLRPACAPPRLLNDGVVLPNQAGLRFGNEMVLTGYGLDRDAVFPRDDLTVPLYWRALGAMKKDYTVFVHLVGPRGELVGARDTYPELGRCTTTQWKAGDALADPVVVPVLNGSGNQIGDSVTLPPIRVGG